MTDEPDWDALKLHMAQAMQWAWDEGAPAELEAIALAYNVLFFEDEGDEVDIKPVAFHIKRLLYGVPGLQEMVNRPWAEFMQPIIDETLSTPASVH